MVRDRIPEIIKGKGGVPKAHRAGKVEYWQKLREKLDEEVAEFQKDQNAEELADIMEVVNALAVVLRSALCLKRHNVRGTLFLP